MAVSDAPWDGSASRFSLEQWRRSTLVHPSTPSNDKGDYSLPVREPDGTLNRNAVQAAAGRVHELAGDKSAAAKKVISLYKELGETPPDALTSLAGGGGSVGRSQPVRWTRDFPLENIEILTRSKGGDGRTVEAYAAVFNRPAEIHDEHGDYNERIHPSAFTRAVNSGVVKRAQCLYNHGYNPVTRRPDVVASVALGTPLDIRIEERGLLTVTRYNKTPLAEATLEAIKDGQIQSQSFEGPCYRSDPMRVPRVRRGESLPLVTRMELGLRNYGPTPLPAYDEPMVTAVRSLMDQLKDIDADELREFIELYRSSTHDGDPLDESTTPDEGLGAGDSRDAHSGRLIVQRNLMAMETDLAMLGIKPGG